MKLSSSNQKRGRNRGQVLTAFRKRYNADRGGETDERETNGSNGPTAANGQAVAGGADLPAELRGRTTTRLARATEPSPPGGSFEEAVATLKNVVNM